MLALMLCFGRETFHFGLSPMGPLNSVPSCIATLTWYWWMSAIRVNTVYKPMCCAIGNLPSWLSPKDPWIVYLHVLPPWLDTDGCLPLESEWIPYTSSCVMLWGIHHLGLSPMGAKIVHHRVFPLLPDSTSRIQITMSHDRYRVCESAFSASHYHPVAWCKFAQFYLSSHHHKVLPPNDSKVFWSSDGSTLTLLGIT